MKIRKSSGHTLEEDSRAVHHDDGKHYYEVELRPEDGHDANAHFRVMGKIVPHRLQLLLDHRALSVEPVRAVHGENGGRAINRVGGGLAAPVLPHHRTYSLYPAVFSTGL